MYETIYFETSKGNPPIADFLAQLKKDRMFLEVTKTIQLIDALGRYGPEMKKYLPKSCKNLREEIRELRSGSVRILYTHLDNGKYLLLHAFIKKRNDTPPKEIDRAIKERKTFLSNDP